MWLVVTGRELSQMGARIPSAWTCLIPFAYFFWLSKYCDGAELVSNGDITAGPAFARLVIPIVNFYAASRLQAAYNSISHSKK